MSQQIIDLDALVPQDLKVKIDGQLYSLPSDIPIPDYLALGRDWDALREATGDEAAELMQGLFDRVLELFRIKQPELEPEDLPLGPRHLAGLVLSVYGRLAEEAPESDPPTKPRNGTRSTSRKKPTRSRSSK